jgi:hypothetical protein
MQMVPLMESVRSMPIDSWIEGRGRFEYATRGDAGASASSIA